MRTVPAQWPQRFEDAHQVIANYFGVLNCEQILLTPGCTSSLAVGVGDVQLVQGQRVLTSHWEHHALHRPLLKLAEAGIAHELIPPSSDGRSDDQRSAMDLDRLEDELRKGDVGLVALTAACNVTGELLPFEHVIEVAHRYGAMVLLDAAQVVGWMPLDLPSLGADIVAFGGHKGLQAPWGIGGLFLSERAQMNCLSATCSLPNPTNVGEVKPPRPGYCDVGSVDQIALAGLHAAIQWLQQTKPEESLRKARDQIQRFQQAVQSCAGVRIYGPLDPNRRMPSFAFSCSGASSGELAERLKQQEVIVGSGLQCAPLAHQMLETQDQGLVRVSVGVGQSDDEIDEAIDRVQRVLRAA